MLIAVAARAAADPRSGSRCFLDCVLNAPTGSSGIKPLSPSQRVMLGRRLWFCFATTGARVIHVGLFMGEMSVPPRDFRHGAIPPRLMRNQFFFRLRVALPVFQVLNPDCSVQFASGAAWLVYLWLQRLRWVFKQCALVRAVWPLMP